MLLAISDYWFIFARTRALQKGRGGREGSLLCGVMGFQLFSRGAGGSLCLSCFLCRVWRLGVCHAARTQCRSPKEVELVLKPICPNPSCVEKSHLSHSMLVEKCVTTRWQCEMLEEMSLGHSLRQPYKLRCMQSVPALWQVWVFLLKVKDNRGKQSHTDELQPFWGWIAPGSISWELPGTSK